jgi:adenylate cyclase
MVEKPRSSPLAIDLNHFKLHIGFKTGAQLTLHFNSPSRRFYLCVIALVVNEMKKSGKMAFIPLGQHHAILALLNDTVGGSAGASGMDHLLPRIYRKWQHVLPNLEQAPLFKVLGKKKDYDQGAEKSYSFAENQKDSWANLFEYKGSEKDVRLKFALDKLNLSPEDVQIIYENDTDGWDRFISDLRKKMRAKPEEIHEEKTTAPISVFWKLRANPALLYRWGAFILATGLVAVLAAVTFHWLYISGTPQLEIPRASSVPEAASIDKMAFPLPDRPSIAVLPFSNMSDDSNQVFFCDGLTEQIIFALSRTRKMFVIAGSTAFAYRGRTVSAGQVCEELGVQYVLEGSVQKSSDRLRITAKLIDGLKGSHLWSERYEGDIKDYFLIQDDIAKKIVTAVHVELTDGELARMLGKGTADLQAYLKVSEALWHVGHSTREGVLRAEQLAEEAITIDPEYAYAYVALGSAQGVRVWLGISHSPGESLRRCIELLQKAVSLDESSGVAHGHLGYWLVVARQYDRAIAAVEKAITLDPALPSVLNNYAATLTFAGRREEAIPYFREALRINPKPSNTFFRHFGVALRDSGRHEEAIEIAKKALAQEPHDILAYIVLASACQLAGREQEARDAVQELIRIHPSFSLERIAQTTPHKDREVADRFIEALRKAGLK